jgi:hypothetical protein
VLLDGVQILFVLENLQENGTSISSNKKGIYCGFSQKTILRASKRKKGNTFICGLDMEVFEIMRVPLNHPFLKNVP